MSLRHLTVKTAVCAQSRLDNTHHSRLFTQCNWGADVFAGSALQRRQWSTIHVLLCGNVLKGKNMWRSAMCRTWQVSWARLYSIVCAPLVNHAYRNTFANTKCGKRSAYCYQRQSHSAHLSHLAATVRCMSVLLVKHAMQEHL